MFTQSHTILLITRQVLARIDLSGKRRLSVKQIWTKPSCDYDALVPEVSRTLQLGTRRPGRVTVVSPDFWTDVLSVPADVTAIANENEIVQALALEAEVDSGLSAFESRMTALKLHDQDQLDEDSQWCVTQVAHAQLRELSHSLRIAGTRLHCIAHPIVAHLAAADGLSPAQVRELLLEWREQTEFTEDAIAKLATDWAACLTLSPKFSMLMMGEADSLPTTKPIALTASLALLAAGGCGMWHWHTEQRIGATTQAIERLEKQQSQHEATEAALKSAEASIVQLRQELSKAQGVGQATERQLQLASTMHSQHNRRWLALIDALAESASEDCWVQRLESNSAETIVDGLALDNSAANSFAGRLESALQGSGWRAAPAATGVSPHNLIAFKIILKASFKPDEPTVNSKFTLNALEHGSIAASNELARGTQP